MARYKRNGYKDDPTVSAKLVKFMAVNTGFEALEAVVVKVKGMEAELAASRKESAAANKAAASAANKTDELKKLCDLLVKRITKLET
jgi:predicted phage tail protein